MLMEQIIRVVLLYEHHFPLPWNPHSILAISLLPHLHPIIIFLSLLQDFLKNLYSRKRIDGSIFTTKRALFLDTKQEKFPNRFCFRGQWTLWKPTVKVVVVVVKSLNVSCIKVVDS